MPVTTATASDKPLHKEAIPNVIASAGTSGRHTEIAISPAAHRRGFFIREIQPAFAALPVWSLERKIDLLHPSDLDADVFLEQGEFLS